MTDVDRTTENENPALDIALDNDDDDTAPPPGTPGATLTPNRPGATSRPYQPGAASTPSGEVFEMSNMSQEQSGLVPGPGEQAWKALTFIFPDANATAVDQSAALQQERSRNSQEIRSKTQTKQQLEEAAQYRQTLKQELDALHNQSKQLDDEIRELEDQAGPSDEEAIQRRKDEKRVLEEEYKRKREQYYRAYADAKQALQLQVEINNLKLANRDIDRQINKLGIKVGKPLDELEQEKDDLKKRLAENRRVLEDENASPSDIEAAKKQVEQDERALERINEDMEREEQKLPLRERVKNIFKKYGWTLQAVALAVGIVLSALALAATNALKAGTKAVGRGLLAIGKKLGSLLPGLIGSIVSFIFKAAGQAFSFLGEHAWLLILAVVAFFIEKLLKKRRKQ